MGDNNINHIFSNNILLAVRHLDNTILISTVFEKVTQLERSPLQIPESKVAVAGGEQQVYTLVALSPISHFIHISELRFRDWKTIATAKISTAMGAISHRVDKTLSTLRDILLATLLSTRRKKLICHNLCLEMQI